MARQLHPRRGIDLRPSAPRPLKPVIDATLLSELRELVLGLAQRLGDPREEARALARSLDQQSRKLDDLAALQNDTARRLLETGAPSRSSQLAKVRTRTSAWLLSTRDRLAAISPFATAGSALPEPASSAAQPLSWVLADSSVHGSARAVLVLVCGLASEDRRAIVARIVAGHLPPGVLPVFVTDGIDFEPFRACRAFFEHLPLRPSQPPPRRRDHELYAARRFTLLCDKWKPVRVVAFGAVAARQLEEWGRSPHVAPAVRTLLLPAPSE